MPSIRISDELKDELEKVAVYETTKRQKVTSIGQVANEILLDYIQKHRENEAKKSGSKKNGVTKEKSKGGISGTSGAS